MGTVIENLIVTKLATAKDRMHAQLREKQEIYNRRDDPNYLNIRAGGAGRPPAIDKTHTIYEISVGGYKVIGMTSNLSKRISNYLSAARAGVESNPIYDEIRFFVLGMNEVEEGEYGYDAAG